MQSAFTPAGELLIGFCTHCDTRVGLPVHLTMDCATTRLGGIYAVIGSAIYISRIKTFRALQVFVNKFRALAVN